MLNWHVLVIWEAICCMPVKFVQWRKKLKWHRMSFWHESDQIRWFWCEIERTLWKLSFSTAPKLWKLLLVVSLLWTSSNCVSGLIGITAFNWQIYSNSQSAIYWISSCQNQCLCHDGRFSYFIRFAKNSILWSCHSISQKLSLATNTLFGT